MGFALKKAMKNVDTVLLISAGDRVQAHKNVLEYRKNVRHYPFCPYFDGQKFGIGLQYEDSFSNTHLGIIGKK